MAVVRSIFGLGSMRCSGVWRGGDIRSTVPRTIFFFFSRQSDRFRSLQQKLAQEPAPGFLGCWSQPRGDSPFAVAS